MKKLGIIDIGSNSVRMVVLHIKPDGSFRLIDEVKETLRLGERNGDSRNLQPEKMRTAIETLRFFKDLGEALEVDELVATATEAVRRAPNREDFLKMVQEEIGIRISVLSGMQESYYDYFGAINTMVLSDCLIMDIGGASTELILVRNREFRQSVSLPFGAITMAEMFRLKDPLTEETRQKMRKFLYSEFANLTWLESAGPLVGIGGSFRNLSKIDRKLKNYPLDITHNYSMTDMDVNEIFRLVSGKSAKDRTDIKGLSADRADIFPGALAEIEALLDFTGIKSIQVSGAGLREGIGYEHMLGGREPVRDVLENSLDNLVKNFGVNERHASNVWNLSRTLYHQLQEELGIERNQERVLKTAALLHDCGINVSYYDHHKHSFYTILNSRINGLSHKELVMAAMVAAMHRKDEMKLTAPFKSLLDRKEYNTVRQLGIMVRIAESLDRRQNGNVIGIESQIAAKTVTLRIQAWISPGLEINDAKSIAGTFARTFGKQLQIQESEEVDSVE
ncbi:Ppx/GppA phosphatase family protein [Parasporobacterium paucivorans]|uniref:Exopolyphosphatase / guanosine-5'-triphosphate,3'-diphosphate pyrophosphatase n=1 Tax=Parasporobacterium paucivorans DSM 15970 TaxID=1122934 RepID=A0A1M6JF06_9FIRM|nr:Ppx/GppA phosphatase family protein [Parasporobacterium paucivorans]SHJ45276.1 exopolyphosphatase / guanosine-5'-triphosphate,3'-diphosphate pyrophosphatase [Parasporobacterium paucivorans DSM 15970]